MIRAETHSDDFVFEVAFDAIPFFEQASVEQIVELAKCEWRGDYPADAVAQHVQNLPGYEDVAIVLDYTTRKREMGFEVSVDANDAMRWLRANRPETFDAVCAGADLEPDDYAADGKTVPAPR